MKTWVVPVGLAILWFQGPPPQQASLAATAMIAGTLTSADAGRPVRRAQVRAVCSLPKISRTTTSDAEGRFAFADLPAGEYTLTATKPGYVDVVFGARRPGASSPGTPIRVEPGQRRDDIAVRMPRGGVITGIVSDEFGDPAFAVPVRAMRLAFSNGERTATTGGNAVTDDLGAYRIAGLPQGEYLVVAQPRDTVAAAAAAAVSLRDRQADILASARAAGNEAAVRATMTGVALPSRLGYVPVYYPAALLPSGAAPVKVGVAEVLSGIDMQLQVLETAAVSGTVTNAAGAPTAASVQLIDPAMPIANIGVWFRTARSDGRFAFHGVVPGSYAVRASGRLPGLDIKAGGFVTGLTSVTLDGSGADVAVTLRRGVSVSGSVDLETLKAGVDPSRLTIDLLAIPLSADWEAPLMSANPDASGRFAMRGVAPGRYRVGVRGLPDGWVLASAVFNEKEAADYNLLVEPKGTYAGGVLKFTARTSEIVGSVTNPSGEPVTDYVLVLFPADRDQWVPQSRRIHVAQASSDGRFAIRGLPAGDYRLAPIAAVEPGQQFDAEFLTQALVGSVAVTLAEGERRSRDIRVK